MELIMTNVFVFSQNVNLESIAQVSHQSSQNNRNVFISTHYLFQNERSYLSSLFDNVEFKTFADYLSDEEMANCDIQAYSSDRIEYNVYLANIKKLKNELVCKKVLAEYKPNGRFLLSTELGIDGSVWKRNGFKYKQLEYYSTEKGFSIRSQLSRNEFINKIYRTIVKPSPSSYIFQPEEVFVSEYNNRKYVFIGKMNRIGYRLSIDFKPSVEEAERLNRGEFDKKDKCTYMTTWHEHGKCKIQDDEAYTVRWAQDGYLPPNYTHKDYYFKPKNVKYYCWDKLGMQLFINQGLPYEMIPFRKKLYMPEPIFPKEVKRILIVASGSGDWTALKNRSDDDLMVDAFAQIAKMYPNISFTYRCHPTWIHPLNVGVNAINRVHEYFCSLNLPNLKLSSNMPLASADGKFQYSFSRSSLDEDLKNADLVFGEHSISMIDAAFKGVPFSSVNLTNRRNFFVGMNDLGFPTCSSYDEIEKVILNAGKADFVEKYRTAIRKYNKMTEEDE